MRGLWVLAAVIAVAGLLGVAVLVVVLLLGRPDDEPCTCGHPRSRHARYGFVGLVCQTCVSCRQFESAPGASS